MKIEMPADKKKEIEECAAKVSELLRTAKTLDEAEIPDSVKSPWCTLQSLAMAGCDVRVSHPAIFF